MKSATSNLAADSVPPTPPALASVSGYDACPECEEHLGNPTSYAALVVAFVQGAKWWEYHQTGATMWASDQDQAEGHAEEMARNGTLGKSPNDQALRSVPEPDVERKGKYE